MRRFGERTRPSTRVATWLPPSGWSPLFLNPVLWLDAADESTITQSNNAVSEWRDKSGNLKHASQGTGSRQPTFVASGINGLGSLQWPNAANDDSMSSGSITVSDVFIVNRFDDGTRTTWRAAFQGLFGVGNTIGVIGTGDNPTAASVLYPINVYSTGRLNGGAEVDLNNNYVYLPRPAALLHARASNANTGALHIGQDRTNNSLNRGWSGLIAEIVCFSSALSTADRQQLETYFNAKWNLW